MQRKLIWDLWTQSFRIWQQLKKLPQQVGDSLCLCFTQPSCIIQWLLPFSSVAGVTDDCQPDGWSAAKASPTCFWKKEKSMVPKGSQLAMYVFSSCSDQSPSQTVVREQKTEDLLSFHHVKMYGHITPTVGGLTGQLAASVIPRGAEYCTALWMTWACLSPQGPAAKRKRQDI